MSGSWTAGNRRAAGPTLTVVAPKWPRPRCPAFTTRPSSTSMNARSSFASRKRSFARRGPRSASRSGGGSSYWVTPRPRRGSWTARSSASGGIPEIAVTDDSKRWVATNVHLTGAWPGRTGSAADYVVPGVPYAGSERAERRHPMSERPASRRAIDLSREIVDGMVTHRGIPGPTISTFLTHEASAARYAPGTTLEIGRIGLVANTGTYLDTPAHRFAGRGDLGSLGRSRRSSTSTGSSSTSAAPRSARSGPRPSPGCRSPDARSSSPRAGIATGARMRTSVGQSVPDRGSRSSPGRRRRGAHRDRIAQRRLARRSAAARSHGDPRCRHPAGRAPDRPRSAPPDGFRFFAVPPDPGDGDLPGASLRAHRRLIPGPSGGDPWPC